MAWKTLHFTRTEFAEDGMLGNPQLLKNLDDARALLGERMFPSTAPGSFARVGGSIKSQHYIGEDINNPLRKTTASDMFIEGLPIENFMKLYNSGLFNGIGVYLDTRGVDGKPWVMFHLDIRESGYGNVPLFWFGVKSLQRDGSIITKYKYPQLDSRHWSLLKNEKLYRERSLSR